jgi:dipeptidyl aminopeptidase/acylaminoacyl peptidase
MAHAELALSRSGPSEPESLNQQQYGPFKVWTEARMYHAIVKRIARQDFLRVNQKDYTPILKGCSPGIHHRFGGHHALGGERHDRDALKRGFERLGRLAPTLQLTVHDVRVKGDASGMVTEQLEAVSKDGTKVPYFIVRRKDIKYDGANPTLLTAYGGFLSSETPDYSALRGKLWLERGGVFVLANIRGGGEFGTAWHEAGLKTHRQRIYDDFAAVGQDLVTRKITTPRRLGIVVASNGGLLMGVEMTQHPEMRGMRS